MGRSLLQRLIRSDAIKDKMRFVVESLVPY
ncbi:hypothetical protein PSPO01_15447 [Paraphaeosphaeria sporulosa]